jgi:hypothetical protein
MRIERFISSEPVSLEKPPKEGGYALWGFYFMSEALSDDENRRVVDGIKREVENRLDFNAAAWDESDPSFRAVMHAFGVTLRPAFVITRPWFGEFEYEDDWKHLLESAEAGDLPVHVAIQDQDPNSFPLFRDVPALIRLIEQFDLVFCEKDADIKRDLLERRLGDLAGHLGDWMGGILKEVDIKVGFQGVTVEISYNDKGQGKAKE